MKFSNAPFILTLIAGFLPLIAALFDAKLFVYLPFILTLLTFFLLLYKKQQIKFKLISTETLVALLFLLFHGIGTSLTVGHGSLGLLGLVITSMLYVQLLNSSSTVLCPDKLAAQLFVIYLPHVIYVFLELSLRVIGYQDVLLNLFGSAQNVTKLKDYNSAAFLWFLGFPTDFFGLNGMLLGSQSAGQVMLSAFLVSAVWYKYSLLAQPRGWTYSTVAFFAFLITINMTMSLVLCFIVLLMVYFVPLSRIKIKLLKIGIPIILIAFGSVIIPIIFFRIEDFDRDIQIYSDAFGSPLEMISDLSLIEVLFGRGRFFDSSDLYSDFGIGMLLLQVGLLFLLIVGLLILRIIIDVFMETRATRLQGRPTSFSERRWAWLATVNALVSIVWAIGLVHYTPSIELGGMQIFSFSLSLTVVSVRYLRTYRHAIRRNGRQP